MTKKELPTEVKEALNELYDLTEDRLVYFWSDFHGITFYCVILQNSKTEVQLEFVRVFKLGDKWVLSRDNGYAEIR